MEEIKVGEYVRLARNQGINKIEEIDDGVYYLDTPIADEWGYESYAIAKYQLKEEVIAHSPNIIDVIEKGDIVTMKYRHLEVIKPLDETDIADLKSAELKLVSVVTHEQFNSIKYEVI